MEALAAGNEMVAFHHRGFWHAMDTLRDKRQLEDMWASGNAPWKAY
jgi:glucose-1-phosphate cytidylyltransferase